MNFDNFWPFMINTYTQINDTYLKLNIPEF